MAQGNVGYLTEELPNDSVMTHSVRSHESLKPEIRLLPRNLAIQNDSITHKKRLSLSPLADFNGSYFNGIAFRTGLGVNIELQSPKWYFRVGAVGGVGSLDSIFNTRAYYQEEMNNHYNYVDVRGRLSYTPNAIFNFQCGLDNQFIGEGNRSLLLSDYATPYPFAQIRTKFWRVEYTVLYQFMREKTDLGWKSKNEATHYLSLNVAKWLNLSVFETVIFKAKDTLLNRGFEAEYLNPVIFYRPQEYSLGSSDNVLLGFNISSKFKGQTIYSQVMLDEFFLKEIRARSGWWANKFGIQFGVKGRFKSVAGKFFYRAEYNFVRPYTYAHIDETQNYGNQGHALAHPYGSSFHEILGELKWQNKSFLLKLFASYYLIGSDINGENYGSNIYQSYNFRPFEYGHFAGQGKGINGMKCLITFDYRILPKWNMHAFLENHLNYNTLVSEIQYVPVLGVRSMLWNDYRNY